MTRFRAWRSLLLAWFFVGVWSVAFLAQMGLEMPEAKAKLEFTIYPLTAMAPVELVKLRIWVDRDACNRQLVVTMDSGVFARASVIPLDGEGAARYHEVRYTNVPGGEYLVDVAVIDCKGKVAVHVQRAAKYVGVDDPDAPVV